MLYSQVYRFIEFCKIGVDFFDDKYILNLNIKTVRGEFIEPFERFLPNCGTLRLAQGERARKDK